jgi:hypothetical protein
MKANAIHSYPMAMNTPLSSVELIVHTNRQVFWLKIHHPSPLPGFPVVIQEGLLYYSGGTAQDFHLISLLINV